jgi:DNA-binding MarR family transcriptional regulator
MSSGRLQKELKKRRPFDSPEQEAILNIARTADRFGICFARLFREFGLTPSQYNVLRILRGEGKPLPILEVADRMIAAVPGITGLIDRLEAMSLVARDRSTEDRRVVYVAIRDKALDLLAKLDQPVGALHKQLVGHLSPAELKDLIRLLEKARQ